MKQKVICDAYLIISLTNYFDHTILYNATIADWWPIIMFCWLVRSVIIISLLLPLKPIGTLCHCYIALYKYCTWLLSQTTLKGPVETNILFSTLIQKFPWIWLVESNQALYLFIYPFLKYILTTDNSTQQILDNKHSNMSLFGTLNLDKEQQQLAFCNINHVHYKARY